MTYNLECPPLVLCLTEIRLFRNDNKGILLAEYKQLEARIRVE